MAARADRSDNSASAQLNALSFGAIPPQPVRGEGKPTSVLAGVATHAMGPRSDTPTSCSAAGKTVDGEPLPREAGAPILAPIAS